jgi:hypothetical protein
MPMRYSPAFRALMVQKMTDPDGPSPVSLADDLGVSRSSLYRWVSEAVTLDIPDPAEPPSFAESMNRLSNMKRPQDWSAEEKLAAILEAISLSEEELGTFLRSRGFMRPNFSSGVIRCSLALNPRRQSVRRANGSRSWSRNCGANTRLWPKSRPCWFSKKSAGNLGGRGRRHRSLERQQALELVAEAVLPIKHSSDVSRSSTHTTCK